MAIGSAAFIGFIVLVCVSSVFLPTNAGSTPKLHRTEPVVAKPDSDDLVAQRTTQDWISPNDLIQKIEKLGFAIDSQSSSEPKTANFWATQLRTWNNQNGFLSVRNDNDSTCNQVTVKIKGRTKNDITEFYVNAGIIGCKTKDAVKKTKRKAAKAIMNFEPACPDEIKAAVVAKRNAKLGKWTVEHDGESFTVFYQNDPHWEHNEVVGVSGIATSRVTPSQSAKSSHQAKEPEPPVSSGAKGRQESPTGKHRSNTNGQ